MQECREKVAFIDVMSDAYIEIAAFDSSWADDSDIVKMIGLFE
jgi:hypothetical protein